MHRFPPPLILWLLLSMGVLCPSAAARPQVGDPAQTVTIVVPGFNPNGSSMVGPFGVDYFETLLAEVAQISGNPTIQDPGGLTAPNLVTECLYYGDILPAYYTTQDIADLNQVTQQWGGGVPRYALIMAKFVRHVLDRTGAAQANIAGGSFGGLISRYMLHYDLEGLVSSGRIARWVTMEGANNGSWTASNNLMLWLWSQFNVPNVDVTHLSYAWIEANLNTPRDRMSSPNFGEFLVGHTISTHDTANSGGLTNLLMLNGLWEPNDGVLMSSAGSFVSADPVAMYRNRMPTRSWHPVNHYLLSSHQGAWLTLSAFLTGDRRFTVRATALKVHQLNEGGFLNPLPAEIALESEVRSSLGASQWGILEVMCARDVIGGALPIYAISTAGQWVAIDQVVFDDMLLPGETGVELDFSCQELDWDLRFGITEGGGNSLLGSLSTVLAPIPGSYVLTGPAFDVQIEVTTQEYPFARSLWLDSVEDVDLAVLPVSGAAQDLVVDFGLDAAGMDYVVVGGMSGTTPGTLLGNGFLLPLNVDSFTRQMWFSLNSPLYQNFSGQLDGLGKARGVLNSTAAPIPARFLGSSITFVAVLTDLGGAIEASNPVEILIQ